MKFIFFPLALLYCSGTVAQQKHCSVAAISGTWKLCGQVHADSYDDPPVTVNADSLKNMFRQYDNSGIVWHFAADGTYAYEIKGLHKDKGSFSVVENTCTLKFSSKGNALISILYLDDNCMIYWHRNPKTAYLSVYRR